MSRLSVGLPLLGLLLAVGCAQIPRKPIVQEEPMTAPVLPPAQANGSIYQTTQGFQPLFEDRRPRMVGDILTITLNEKANASKNSASSANRDGTSDLSLDVKSSKAGLFGNASTSANAQGTTDFSGKGASNANNSFTGTITVTVMEVWPNGNLRVRGEKQIAINQGTEFIRFSGVVNPRTITQQNTVSSTLVGEARIEYVGDGYINEAQTMGWLQRFFLNVSPF
ncbi:flagellar basal body L-ring protein FlgH [Azotobacter bryophylli]|uniref:Flagellar L-ring protein n=1 Tax=Azotobacter bryophylli TaxID=1986537 RepID=A0ABV7AUU1_9GAMM